MSCNSNRFRNDFRYGLYPPYYPYDAERCNPYLYDPYLYDPYRYGDIRAFNYGLPEAVYFDAYRRMCCMRRATRCCNRVF